MKIVVGSDHRGDAAAAALCGRLRGLGHDVDCVTDGADAPRDYPDPAWIVGRAVSEGRADRGILLCGSGIGMSMAANKVPGVRAALAAGRREAEMSRRHNDANVLCLAADGAEDGAVLDVVETWLATAFEGGRHARRVDKIAAIERGEDPRVVDPAANAGIAPG
ncbi:MAG: RpiB/LacA/LacB family sugar-phosphate isomerase [Planctomycetota bacterium]